jgi:hypothetical protein
VQEQLRGDFQLRNIINKEGNFLNSSGLEDSFLATPEKTVSNLYKGLPLVQRIFNRYLEETTFLLSREL